MKSQCQAIEIHNSRNKTRKFYKKIKRLLEGFETGASFCKEKDGNLVTDVKSTLNIWRVYFDQLLNGDDGNKHAREMTSPNPNSIHEFIKEVVTPYL